MEGQPRPRVTFRGPDEDGIKSPALIDYPYGLVLDHGFVKVHGAPALSPTVKTVLADLLEVEVARLRDEAERASRRGLSSLRYRLGGDTDAAATGQPGQAAGLAEASGE